MFLAGIRRRPRERESGKFPWTIPILENLESLEFSSPVTFFVGENGTGKSTLLEGLAAGMSAVAAGSKELRQDETLAAGRLFATGFRFVRRRHAATRMFLRAEDMFGFTQRMGRLMEELQGIERDYTREFSENSYSQKLAVNAVATQRRSVAARYGENPDAKSHGETFLALLQSRLVPRGLYFLDEPETPLSPIRVLALISLLKDRIANDCQFIIATHSPILMAMPEAQILLLQDNRIEPTDYEHVEHVRITKAFLNNPESFLRQL